MQTYVFTNTHTHTALCESHQKQKKEKYMHITSLLHFSKLKKPNVITEKILKSVSQNEVYELYCRTGIMSVINIFLNQKLRHDV